MNDPNQRGPDQRTGGALETDREASQGPSLKLFYSLIALALVAAIAIAATIVLPFYRNH
jgi:hypothetical protein